MEITTTNGKDKLTISEDVIEAIAMNATKDIEGVSSFSNRPNDVVTTIKSRSLKVMSPVRILQDGDDLSISIYINVAPENKIQDIAAEVQKNVKEAIQNMTGRLVSKVNVIIAGINFEEFSSTAPTESED